MDENLDTPAPDAEETITFKRTHFYSVLVVVAFLTGILTGYFVWGRGVSPARAAGNVPYAQNPAVQPTQAPRYVRYEIETKGFPSLGPADAPITIVEFSDFQCPFCQRFYSETFKQLMAAYPGKIRFVYRHLPLTSIHPEAFPAAEAAMCANQQNAFWDYHDQIFANQDKLGSELYSQIASDLGLDTAKFEACLKAETYKDLIQKDSDFALGLGVQSTPTFFINGLAIVGAQPLTAFTQIIDKELAGEIP